MLVLTVLVVAIVVVSAIVAPSPRVENPRLAASGASARRSGPLLDVPSTTAPATAPDDPAAEASVPAGAADQARGGQQPSPAPAPPAPSGSSRPSGPTAGAPPRAGAAANAEGMVALAAALTRIDRGQGTPRDFQLMCEHLPCAQFGRTLNRQQVSQFVAAVRSGRFGAADLARLFGVSEREAQLFIDELTAAGGR